MQELLRCVCPDEHFLLPYQITGVFKYLPIHVSLVDNFAVLIYLSDRLLLTNLRRELERLANEKESPVLNGENAPMENLIDILVETIQADFTESSIREMCCRIGKFPQPEVIDYLKNTYPLEICDPIEKKLQPYVRFIKHCSSSWPSNYNLSLSDKVTTLSCLQLVY